MFENLHNYLKKQPQSDMLTNLVGTMFWMSAGMLEGSLRALEHAKDKQEAQLLMIQKTNQEEVSKLQNEL